MLRLRPFGRRFITYQEKAILDCYGSCSSGSDEDLECEHSVRESSTLLEHFPDYQSLVQLLQSSEFNWFEFIDRVESVVGDVGAYEKQLEEFRSTIDNDMLRLSYEAYVASKQEVYAEDRTARCINGEIVSETESDNPTDYISTLSTSTSA